MLEHQGKAMFEGSPYREGPQHKVPWNPRTGRLFRLGLAVVVQLFTKNLGLIPHSFQPSFFSKPSCFPGFLMVS